MTESEKERYENYKITFVALMLCYPFGLENLEGEFWCNIKGYNGSYAVSNYGRVKSFKYKTPHIVAPYITAGGYLQVTLYKNGKGKQILIHWLVAEAFVPNPLNLPEVDHIYGNKLDNYYKNLEWVTGFENKRRAYQIGLIKYGEERKSAKLSNAEVLWCRSVFIPKDDKYGIKPLAEKFGVSERNMRKIINCETYKNIEDKNSVQVIQNTKEVLLLNVFENLREGKHYHILDEDYQREVHGEIDRCRHLCHLINSTDPLEKEKILQLEKELFNGNLPENTFLTPPFQIDCACRVFLGKNVFANHGLVMMSVGTITVEDGVMFGPEVGIFSVNHEPKNIRVIMTKEILIKKNAWIGARVNILPGVTIGENAIIGTGSIVTKDIPDNAVAVGNPARVVKMID